jgi:hypothetical protein
MLRSRQGLSSPIVQHAAIHVIESLPTRDVKTGECLFPHLQSLVKANCPEITVHFWTESTADAFLERLRHIGFDTRATGRAPIVHLEAHGAPGGVGLSTTSEEIVFWSDLKAPLAQINVTCRLNLLVVVAACGGAGLLAVLQAHERAPV